MIEAETDFELAEFLDMGDSIGWHGNAVLMRRGVVAREVTPTCLPGFEPRGAMRVTLDNGLVVVATHLGLMRQSRRSQLEVLRDATAADAHVILAGDFNEWSTKKGLEPLDARFSIHSPGRSFHARRPVAALDRFALSGSVELRDCGVEQGPLAKVASDHLPIWSDIEFPAAIC
jgi:endonuclease/exonuclease/phosphatase family metal-dependent hydrolase